MAGKLSAQFYNTTSVVTTGSYLQTHPVVPKLSTLFRNPPSFPPPLPPSLTHSFRFCFICLATSQRLGIARLCSNFKILSTSSWKPSPDVYPHNYHLGRNVWPLPTSAAVTIASASLSKTSCTKTIYTCRSLTARWSFRRSPFHRQHMFRDNHVSGGGTCYTSPMFFLQNCCSNRHLVFPWTRANGGACSWTMQSVKSSAD